MKTINFEKISENLSKSSIICAYNELCQERNDFDSMLYCMDEIDEVFPKSSDAISSFFYGYRYNPYNGEAREENNPNDEYFYFNGYGNMCTVQEYDVKLYCDFTEFDEGDVMRVLSQYADEEDFTDGEDEEEAED